jgi:hypothetical protein
MHRRYIPTDPLSLALFESRLRLWLPRWGTESKGPDDHWYSPATPSQRYAKITINDVSYKVHVLAWVVKNYKTYDPTLWVLHHCDIPRCDNPEHLYQGDCIDNVNDRTNRNRTHFGGHTGVYPVGPANGNCKIPFPTIELIRKRRAEGLTYDALEAEFGIDRMQIFRYVHGVYRKAA